MIALTIFRIIIMKIPKIISKSLILDAISKLNEKVDAEKLEEAKNSTHQMSFDIGDIMQTDNSFISYNIYPEDKLENFLSEEVSMLNDVDHTPSFNSRIITKQNLVTQTEKIVDCAPSKTRSKGSSTDKIKYAGISIAV